jgi:hypothetical protein
MIHKVTLILAPIKNTRDNAMTHTAKTKKRRHENTAAYLAGLVQKGDSTNAVGSRAGRAQRGPQGARQG